MTEDIPGKYSEANRTDSRAGSRAGSDASGPRLYAIDSGSLRSSVALSWRGEVESREFQVGDSSGRLLTDLDELLFAAGGRIEDLDGLVALAGPGSFTGLRVGLATTLGLHQALGTPATAVTTFRALAWQARRRLGPSDRRIVAAVDALRGERFIQTFDGRTVEPVEEPVIRANEAVAGLEGPLVIGFGLDALRVAVQDSLAAPAFLEAEALAPDLLEIALAPGFAWDASRLTEPLYLRPPAVTPRSA